MIFLQGRYDDALSLHQDLNYTIQNLFDPCHELAHRSKTLLARLKYSLGEEAEAERLEREVLEIRLKEFGQRHGQTLRVMSDLSYMMTRRNLHAQSQRLLSTTVQIASQTTGYTWRDLYGTKLRLAEALGKLGRNKEAENLVRDELRSSWPMYGMLHLENLRGIHFLAEFLRDREQFEKCVLLSNGNLRRYLQSRAQHTLTLGLLLMAMQWLWLSWLALQKQRICMSLIFSIQGGGARTSSIHILFKDYSHNHSNSRTD